jgi:hypothetical protein
VSNICDVGYLGCAKTLFSLGSLLQKQSTNSHATLIMLFMNAIEENLTLADQTAVIRHAMAQVVNFLPPPVSIDNPYDPVYMKYMVAADLFRDNDQFFDKCASKSLSNMNRATRKLMFISSIRYMTKWKFEECGRLTNMAMKNNTIVEKWPMRLRRKVGQPGAKEEFDLLLGSGHGNERYVEWQAVE